MNDKEKLRKVFGQMNSKLPDIKVINLTTADGFAICSLYNENHDLEENKLSAAASSLAALSVAAAKQLIGSNFESTTIETKNGCMILVSTKYQEKKCVLCLVSGKVNTIGQVRYFAFKLAKYIEKSFIVGSEK